MSDSKPVDAIAPLEHDEAMVLAATGYDRRLNLVGTLSDPDWDSPTDCVGWAVKDILGHLVGMLELQADPNELRRQVSAAAQLAATSGRLRLDELTALQVREHDHLDPAALADALHQAVPRGLAARAAVPAERRATPYDPSSPENTDGRSDTCSTSSTPATPGCTASTSAAPSTANHSCPPSTTGGSSPTSSRTGRPGTPNRSNCT